MVRGRVLPLIAGLLLVIPTIVTAADIELTEARKIEALIKHVAELEGSVFVRNGKEYPTGVAAKHFKGKWHANHDRIHTAREFIANVASYSSASGEAYLIRFRRGTEQTTAEYLLAELESLETETQKIEAIIKHVAEMKDGVFVRNGKAYDADTAARFIRGKWKANEDEIKTAEEFIEKAASSSSTSGKPYLIRFKDGTEKKSGDYLKSVLKKLENKAA